MKYRLFVGFCLAASAAWAQGLTQCQIMDRVEDPAWQAHLEYVPAQQLEGTGQDMGMMTVRGGGGIYYWQTEYGDVDLGGRYDVTSLQDDGGLGVAKEYAALRLRAVYTWRNTDGISYRTEAEPGYYSDLDSPGFDSLYMPIGFSVIQTFNAQCSGLIGVMAYPGMDRLLDPRFGVRYAFNDMVYADLMYPESKVVVSPERDLEFMAGFKVGPRQEYRLTEDDRESIIFDETRFFAGMNMPVTEGLRLMTQFGFAMGRQVGFGETSTDYDLDSTFFASVGVGGTL